MAGIKSMDKIAQKWSRVASTSGQSYQEGVQEPRKDWKAQTLAANNNWKQGTQQAITANRFQTGVNNTPTSKWQEGAINKGVDRYTAGVQLGAGNYAQGFAPFVDVIKSTVLPDRKPKGDPSNIQRVSVMAKALHDKKLALSQGK